MAREEGAQNNEQEQQQQQQPWSSGRSDRNPGCGLSLDGGRFVVVAEEGKENAKRDGTREAAWRTNRLTSAIGGLERIDEMAHDVEHALIVVDRFVKALVALCGTTDDKQRVPDRRYDR